MDLESLPEELRELARRQLATGRYKTLADLLGEALRVHGEQEAYFEANRDEFRERIARGVAQAERGELRDGEAAMADIARHIDERRRRGA
jgi:Arc/MetJ-type ribon-helix-helix transcriptional regulator